MEVVKTISQEPMLDRIDEQIVDVTVPQLLEESSWMKQWVQQCAEEHIVNATLPHVVGHPRASVCCTSSRKSVAGTVSTSRSSLQISSKRSS